MFPRGPVSFQRPYRRSAGITQARFELAFDREHPEKTALVLGCAPTVAAKSRSTKSIILSQGMDIVGVSPAPVLSLADGPDDILHLMSRNRRPRPAGTPQKVGTPAGLRYRACKVNTIECQWGLAASPVTG